MRVDIRHLYGTNRFLDGPSILLIAEPLQMFDPLLDALDVAEHHRRARFQSQLVRCLHDFEPLRGITF